MFPLLLAVAEDRIPFGIRRGAGLLTSAAAEDRIPFSIRRGAGLLTSAVAGNRILCGSSAA